MGNKSTSGRSTARRYSPEDKARAVRLVRQLRKELGTSHGTVQRVADQIGCGVESLRTWVKQADIDEGVEPGVTTAETRQIRELEQASRELRRANDLLKRASAFFTGALDPRNPLIVAFVDEMRADGHAVESICRVLRQQGCQ